MCWRGGWWEGGGIEDHTQRKILSISLPYTVMAMLLIVRGDSYGKARLG